MFVISGHPIFNPDCQQNSKYISDMFAHRKALFGDQFGWAQNVTENAEFDQYDNQHTVYGLIVNDAEQVTAYVRLIPTSARVKFGNEIYSTFVQDGAAGKLPNIPQNICYERPLCGPGVWEMTRFHAATMGDMKLLILGFLDYLRSKEVRTLVSFTRIKYVKLLSRLGFPTQRTGPIIDYDGIKCATTASFLIARDTAKPAATAQESA